MNDRQTYNWRKAQNAMDGLHLMLRANTESVCEGIRFLEPIERAILKATAELTQRIANELLQNQRSRHEDGIELIKAGHTDATAEAPTDDQPEDSLERLARLMEADKKGN